MKHYTSWEHRLKYILEVALSQVERIDAIVITIELFSDILPVSTMQTVVASKFSIFCDIFVRELSVYKTEFIKHECSPPIE